MAYNTVGSVCNRAVELAQLDSSFLKLSRQYYNLALNDQVTNYNFPYFRVQLTDTVFIPGQTAYDLPDDYSRSDTCYLVDGFGNRTPIIIMSKYRFDRIQSSPVSGDPRAAYIDINNNQIVFNSSPNTTRYYRLTYFRIPDEIDEEGGNDSDEIDFQNPMALIYLITANLMDYTDDQRAEGIMQKAEKMMRDNKLLSYDEDNQSIVELGPNYRAGSRATRGGSGGFNF